MTLEQLLALRPHQIIMEPVPIDQLLVDSLYYPDCKIDGEIIRSCNRSYDRDKIVSFIYADPFVRRRDLLDNMDGFTGYKILSTQSFDDSRIGIERPVFYSQSNQPFAQWIVYQRLPGFGMEFGPERFSLLFFGGEGADGAHVFDALYVSKRQVPKALVARMSINDDGNPYAFAIDSGLCPDIIYLFEDNPGEDELPWATYAYRGDADIHPGPGGRGNVSIWRCD